MRSNRFDRRFWLLKGKDRLTDWGRVLESGATSDWFTRRPPADWASGDGIVFWRAAPHLQVVGIGDFNGVVSRSRSGETIFRVTAHAEPVRKPVTAEALRQNPHFSGASFLKSGPAGTVFRLAREQAIEVAKLAGLAPPVFAAPHLERALVVMPGPLSRILAGTKTWEMRNSHTHVRGLVGLIESKSGHVVGVTEVVDSRGPLSLAGAQRNAARMGFLPSRAYVREGHFAWVLRNSFRLRTPVPYKHPSGAIIWVKLRKSVSDAVVTQLK